MIDTFKEDIIIGEEAEYEILSIIRKKYSKAYKMEGKYKPYDIYDPENDIKVEVKKDIGSKETPNYFIEYECNNEDSGIASTEANYWVICDEDKCMWIKISKLLSLVHLYGKTWQGIPNGGVSKVKAYLLPKEHLISHADKITKPHESSN